MKKTIGRILLFVLGTLAGPAVSSFFPAYTAFFERHPWWGIGSVLLLVLGLFWYWRTAEKQDQRDVKTVVEDVKNILHLPGRCLTETNVSRIEGAPSLMTLLNSKVGVTSRVMNKRQRIDLPESSCVLQVSFIPIDKNGNTILWKRMPKNHVFRSGDGSILISFSPYARKFADVFVFDRKDIGDRDRGMLSSLGITCVGLRDIYSREVPNVSMGDIVPVGAYWLPRQKDSHGCCRAPAYCFWVFAVKYDVDFNDKDVVDAIFGRKLDNGKTVYLKKDNDKKVRVLSLKDFDAYKDSDQLALGKMDIFIASNYAKFLDGACGVSDAPRS